MCFLVGLVAHSVERRPCRRFRGITQFPGQAEAVGSIPTESTKIRQCSIDNYLIITICESHMPIKYISNEPPQNKTLIFPPNSYAKIDIEKGIENIQTHGIFTCIGVHLQKKDNYYFAHLHNDKDDRYKKFFEKFQGYDCTVVLSKCSTKKNFETF